MFERVSGQCGMVHLDVHLEVLLQTVRTEEADDGFRVHVVLVLGRFHRFRLDEERALEAFGAGVVAGSFNICARCSFSRFMSVFSRLM